MTISTFHLVAAGDMAKSCQAIERQLRRMAERNGENNNGDTDAAVSRFVNFLNICSNVLPSFRWGYCAKALSNMNDADFLACLPFFLKSDSMPSIADNGAANETTRPLFDALRERIANINDMESPYLCVPAGDCMIGYSHKAQILAVANFKADTPLENSILISADDMDERLAHSKQAFGDSLMHLLEIMARAKGASTQTRDKITCIHDSAVDYLRNARKGLGRSTFRHHKPGA